MRKRNASRLSWLAGGWLVFLVAVSLFADSLPLPYAADTTDLAAITEPPGTGSHYLGTDPQGRDVLAGLVYGARTALSVSLPAAVLATLLGTALGSIAGFWRDTRLLIPAEPALATGCTAVFLLLVRGPAIILLPAAAAVAGLVTLVGLVTRPRPYRTVALPIDSLLMSLMALLAAIPLLLLALTLTALQSPSLPGLLAVLVCTFWPGPARLVRAEVLRLTVLPYAEAGRALGLPTGRLLWRHILPNCWPLIRATFPISVATLIGVETTLSFLGVGLPPEVASWGRILAVTRLAPTAWWLILGPALAILFTTLSLHKIATRRRTL
jgi:peptide/nickel transport system permease protein